MLSNAYFLAKFRFDTAENEPAKNLQNFRKMHFLKMHFLKMHFSKIHAFSKNAFSKNAFSKNAFSKNAHRKRRGPVPGAAAEVQQRGPQRCEVLQDALATYHSQKKSKKGAVLGRCFVQLSLRGKILRNFDNSKYLLKTRAPIQTINLQAIIYSYFTISLRSEKNEDSKSFAVASSAPGESVQKSLRSS